MAHTALVVLTTLATEGEARTLVAALIYRWEGAVTEEAEVVVLLKTDESKWDALCAAVRAKHPYQVPELLALPVERGLDLYLSWLTSEVVG